MLTSLPIVQHDVKQARRVIDCSAWSMRAFKCMAHRAHRRAINRTMRILRHDPERFYDEPFDAPSLSGWDIA